jgi:hypothetical protein
LRLPCAFRPPLENFVVSEVLKFDHLFGQVHATFRIRKSQKYTSVNKDGFEVDITCG